MLEIWWKKELYLATLFSASTSHQTIVLEWEKNQAITKVFWTWLLHHLIIWILCKSIHKLIQFSFHVKDEIVYTQKKPLAKYQFVSENSVFSFPRVVYCVIKFTSFFQVAIQCFDTMCIAAAEMVCSTVRRDGFWGDQFPHNNNFLKVNCRAQPRFEKKQIFIYYFKYTSNKKGICIIPLFGLYFYSIDIYGHIRMQWNTSALSWLALPGAYLFEPCQVIRLGHKFYVMGWVR